MRETVLALNGLPFQCTTLKIAMKVIGKACALENAFRQTSSAAATRSAIGSSNRLLGHMNNFNIKRGRLVSAVGVGGDSPLLTNILVLGGSASSPALMASNVISSGIGSVFSLSELYAFVCQDGL